MLKAVQALFIVAIVAAAGAAFALDPRIPMTQYGHRRWQTADGLPQSTLQAIAQTPDGYLWVGDRKSVV